MARGAAAEATEHGVRFATRSFTRDMLHSPARHKCNRGRRSQRSSSALEASPRAIQSHAVCRWALTAVVSVGRYELLRLVGKDF